MSAAALIADIGGSNSRFALVRPGGRPERVRIVDNDAVPDLPTAIANYLAEKDVAPPPLAVLAVASSVTGDEFALTNRPAWRYRRDELARACGFRRVHVLNDFEALAWALPMLGRADTRPIGASRALADGPKVVLGPGTGLGVAGLLPQGDLWTVAPTESGHTALGPRHADEFPIFERILRAHGPVSVEHVLSGSGMQRLASAMGVRGDSHQILRGAQAGDADALRVARLFVRLLGRFAGDMALVFKATGGVYLAGGVGRGLGALLDEPNFRDAFEAHEPYRALMEAIPTLLITYDEPGLLGCAAVASRLLATMDLDARA